MEGESFSLVHFRVEDPDLDVGSFVRRIAEVTGCGTDASMRNGTIRIFVPASRANEAHMIGDKVSHEIAGLIFEGVTVSDVSADEEGGISASVRKLAEKLFGWGGHGK